MEWLRPDLIARGRIPYEFSNVDHFFYFLLVHRTIKVSDLHRRIEVLKNKRLPTLMVYGELDKLIHKENSERLYRRFGAELEDVVVYGEDGALERNSQRNNWIKVMNFRFGGHFAYDRHCEEVGKHIEEHVFGRIS